MRLLISIVAVLLLYVTPTAQAQTNDLTDFVKRFNSFLETNTAKLSWSATDSARTLPVPMPNAMDVSKTRISDPTSGLWHYPNLQKVYDPETGYYIDYKGLHYYTYKTDTAAGKIFKGETEIQIKRAEKVQK
ncbi:hypothetical protein WG947_14830 [Pontibacter sp. H259]|uniref:hypothetical protein n=1 Tax=Pontibacter sp. H259 TaxID=3133421 RepID=UPI0030BC5ECD